jgi:hypothetical protein
MLLSDPEEARVDPSVAGIARGSRLFEVAAAGGDRA